MFLGKSNRLLSKPGHTRNITWRMVTLIHHAEKVTTKIFDHLVGFVAPAPLNGLLCHTYQVFVIELFQHYPSIQFLESDECDSRDVSGFV